MPLPTLDDDGAVAKVLEVYLHHLPQEAITHISDLGCLEVLEGDGEIYARFRDREGFVQLWLDLKDLAKSEPHWTSLCRIWQIAFSRGCRYLHFTEQGHQFESVETYAW